MAWHQCSNSNVHWIWWSVCFYGHGQWTHVRLDSLDFSKGFHYVRQPCIMADQFAYLPIQSHILNFLHNQSHCPNCGVQHPILILLLQVLSGVPGRASFILSLPSQSSHKIINAIAFWNMHNCTWLLPRCSRIKYTTGSTTEMELEHINTLAHICNLLSLNSSYSRASRYYHF